jgi:hypothetical protein
MNYNYNEKMQENGLYARWKGRVESNDRTQEWKILQLSMDSLGQKFRVSPSSALGRKASSNVV